MSLSDELARARTPKMAWKARAYTPCTGSTLAGQPCRAPATGGGGLCLAHAEPERMAEIARKGHAAQRRPPTLTELLRQRVEEKADRVLAAYVDALEAERVIPVGDGEVVTAPDHALRLRAAESIHDRLEGRPAQRQEHTGAGGGPIGLAFLLADDVRALAGGSDVDHQALELEP